jgi:hypothetical protein
LEHDQKDENVKTFNDPLSERRIARILEHHLQNLGYKVICEFVVNDRFLDLQSLTKKNTIKVRIDVAALKNNKLIFIEVENGLWMTHPLLYNNLAHRVFLAYPAEVSALTDNEQIKIAKEYGIGILKVSSIGSITPVLKPEEKEIPPEIDNTLIALFEKRYQKIKKRTYH